VETHSQTDAMTEIQTFIGGFTAVIDLSKHKHTSHVSHLTNIKFNPRHILYVAKCFICVCMFEAILAVNIVRTISLECVILLTVTTCIFL
jgi:hypothetical protein